MAPPARIDRPLPFLADLAKLPRSSQEQALRSPDMRFYHAAAAEAFAFDDVQVLNSDGVVFVGGTALRDTVDFIHPDHPDAAIAWARPYEYLKLREETEAVPVTGPVFLGHAAGWRNYGHFLLQVVPKLLAFLSLREHVPGLRLALPTLPANAACTACLAALGIAPAEVLMLPPGGASHFAQAWLMENPSIWDVLPLAASAAERMAAALDDGAAGAERVYLHRGSGTRQVSNFAELGPIIAAAGFAVHDFAAASLAEQIRCLRRARFVIAEHGAATTNILFCRPGARVLQLFSPFFVEPAFWSVAAVCELDYGMLAGTSTAATGDTNSTYAVPPDRLEAAIRLLLRDTDAPHPATVRGDAAPHFATVTDAAMFGRSGGDQRILVHAAVAAPPAPPIVNAAALPPDFVAEHAAATPPGPVFAYAAAGASLYATGLIVRDGRFIAPAECFPAYLRADMLAEPHRLAPIHRGSLARADVRMVDCDAPVLSALHPNLLYGYFLLEMLPRLFVAAELRHAGVDFLLALPTTLPRYVTGFARLLGLADGTISYDADTTGLRAPAILLPGMMQQDYQMHPAFNRAIAAITERAGRHGPPTRLFLLRGEDEAAQVDDIAGLAAGLADLGVVAIDPRQMPLEQRLSLLARAELVIGEAGLNDALFAPIGAQVVALNFPSHLQSAIARLRGQHMTFVLPRDGRFRHWRLSADAPRGFSTDAAALRQAVLGALERRRG